MAILDKNGAEIRIGELVTLRLSRISRDLICRGKMDKDWIQWDNRKLTVTGLSSSGDVRLDGASDWIKANEVELE